jgi:cytochrome P450
MSDEFDFDPFDSRFFEDPFGAYRTMRAEHPVYRRMIAEPRIFDHYWMLSRSGDVNDAASDWKTFSSAAGPIIDIDVTLLPPNLFNMDPPRHDELRSALSRVLTPSRVAGLEPHVRAFAEEVVTSWTGRDTVDISTEYAQLIPTITMCGLLDLPTADRAQFLAWNLASHGDDFTGEAALRAYAEMEEYWADLVVERRARPGTDLISQIIHTAHEGERLSDVEITGFCSLLHHASQNTTMNMITNSAIALARRPDLRRRLLDDPAVWPRAIEELMRFISPVQGLARITTTDVTVADVTIPAGDQVLLLYGSANHDETVYDDPETLDFDRTVKFHWGFGHGLHYCLGAAVARLEIRVALSVLLARLGDYEVDEAGVSRYQLVPTRCISHAPIRFAPLPASTGSRSHSQPRSR